MQKYYAGFKNNDALSSFVSEIKNIPMLEKDEEFELARKWHEKGDKKALNKLISSHLKLVHKVAKGYSGYGLPKEDLISEGNLGLMHAIKHFDPEIGYKFSTYAIWWIKAKIKDFVFNSWSLVKIGSNKTNRKLFFKLKQVKAALGIDNLNEEDAEEISKRMEVKKDDVLSMDKRLTHKDFSANTLMGENDTLTWQDFIEDENANHAKNILEENEYQYRKKILHEALNTLSKREYEIICSYRLHNPTKTLREIGEKLNISAERVRQIDISAMLKIQKYIKTVEWDQKNKKQTYNNLVLYFLIPTSYINL